MPSLSDAFRNTVATRTPGLLLQPFGWAARSVMHLATAEPRLLSHLTDLDQVRLHAMALYLAYRDGEPLGEDDAAFLACARSRDILEKATGGAPMHLLGLLRRLPASVLERELYKGLVAIAADEAFARVLMRHSVLTSTEIAKIIHVPASLRSAPLLSALYVDVFRLAAIADVCDWFDRRWNIEAASHYLRADSLSQVRQLTLDLVRSLPAIPAFPPRTVGVARLLESAKDLQRAGRTGKNCLGYVTRELKLNIAAFYVWHDDEEPIYIRVSNPYGLGWFLSQMKLAENKAPDAERVATVEQAFGLVGIDKETVSDALAVLLFDTDDDSPDDTRD